MKRGHPLIAPYEEWLPVMDLRGQWRLLERHSGAEPLRNPDPHAQVVAVYCASQAPALVAIGRSLLPRLERTGRADPEPPALWTSGTSHASAGSA
jgi:hypothetical protein